jgi:formamidopyrimidine-DNA glycosylase
MPELPEVEVVRRGLEKELAGATVASAMVAGTPNALRVIRPHTVRAELEEPLAGATVTAVERLGKNLIVRLSGDRALMVHLGMSGQLLAVAPAAAPRPHTHVVLDVAGGPRIDYVDPRTFGHLYVTDARPGESPGVLAGLGPDALTVSPAALARLLAGRTTKLKAVLMDQRLIAGIGNIYSDEIAFAAGIHPFRPGGTLRPGEVRRLHAGIVEVLEEAVAHRGTSAADEQYRDLYGAVGDHARYLRVYQREGEPCDRCGAPLQRRRWTNRSAHFCASCQT